MTTATLNGNEVTEFWRVARRLHAIYAELDMTFELGLAACAELEDHVDHTEPEALDRVRNWFDQMDARIQVWQLRQLLQSTGLQNEENLRYLIARHLERKQRTEADKEKLDFLLVQYFAHCAPHGITEHQVTLDEVARVLEPVLGRMPDGYPQWAPGLDDKLQMLNDSNSLEELQNSGALLEVREIKLAIGDDYFQPGMLVAFTRFNFRARRAFFKAMHLDLHHIRTVVNELESLGYTTIDCRDAGLTENESLDQVRHVVHQWKTPFRAPYSGGSSFLQLILLRHTLQNTVNEAKSRSMGMAGMLDVEVPVGIHAPEASRPANPVGESPKDFFEIRQESAPSPRAPSLQPVTFKSDPELIAGPDVPNVFDIPDSLGDETGFLADKSSVAIKTESAGPVAIKGDSASNAEPSPVENAEPPAPLSEDEETIQRCVADIHDQLVAVPARNSPSVSAITLGGCKLLIATWEAEAFTQPQGDISAALQRTVASRTILHVCMERHRKGEPTDVGFALTLARKQTQEMEAQIAAAKEANNIDAAVNLAATTKRLLALMDEGEKLNA
jgi:hypothetical protein